MNSGRSRSYSAASRSSRVGAVEAEAHPDVVAQPVAGVDAAAQQDRGRAVRAGREHDRAGAQLARRRREPDGAVAFEQHPVDERVGEDREVLARARRVEVGEGRVPAHRADRVDRVEDRRVARRLGEGGVPGRQLLTRRSPAAASAARRAAGTARSPRGSSRAPTRRSPRRRPREQHAGVVRRAAAEDARAELRAVLAVGLPRVRERERAGVEHVGRPAPGRVRARSRARPPRAPTRRPSSLSRAASTQPAEPPPATSTSKRVSEDTARPYPPRRHAALGVRRGSSAPRTPCASRRRRGRRP